MRSKIYLGPRLKMMYVVMHNRKKKLIPPRIPDLIFAMHCIASRCIAKFGIIVSLVVSVVLHAVVPSWASCFPRLHFLHSYTDSIKERNLINSPVQAALVSSTSPYLSRAPWLADKRARNMG